MRLDLRETLNAISDIAQHRPAPVREFDQILMKLGDLAVHVDFVAERLARRNLVFVGDGDGVGMSLAHLKGSGLLSNSGSPEYITVLDFDLRIVNAINDFARKFGYASFLKSVLYNVKDPLPTDLLGSFDGFHINPPWGRYNEGSSAEVFLERAMALSSERARGICIVADTQDADNAEVAWAGDILSTLQGSALKHGMVIKEMAPRQHAYHLEDSPELRSCTMMFEMREPNRRPANLPLDVVRMKNFYGRNQPLRTQYVQPRGEPNPFTAHPQTYELVPIKDDEK